MLIDTKTLKNEINNRLGFLKGSNNESFENGYELALNQLLEWINLYEDIIKEIQDNQCST